MKKKKYIAILCSFHSIENGFFYVLRSTIKKISENFEKIYVINCQNLRFFPNLAKKIYVEKDYNLSTFDKVQMPKNFILFNPKKITFFFTIIFFLNFLKYSQIYQTFFY